MDVPMRFPDDMKGLKRMAAVVLPKDFGAIVAYTGIGRNTVAAEGGSGSGFMTIQLARICKKVYSFESREEHYRVAKENIDKLGLKNVVIANKPMEGMSQKNLDFIFLDYKDSHVHIPVMHEKLKEGGWLVGYCPNIEQAKQFHLECQKLFRDVFTITTHDVNYAIRDFGCRPDNFALVHTAFLIFAKK
ncbi:MAG: methyltransferase domain-containing protein [Candidatus Micrarchaeia archaeon]